MTEGTTGQPDAEFRVGKVSVPGIATIAIVAAILHFGKDIFLPLAIAMLITFALSPLVSALRNRGLALVATVLSVVAMTFLAIGLFGFIVAGQLSQLATNLPMFQANIVTKLEGLREASSGNGVVSRIINLVSAVNAEIGSATAVAPTSPQGTTSDNPVKVEVVAPASAVQTLQALVIPIIRPVATAGLVIVVVIFMLLEREELRDRFIRLVGSNDLHRTTEMLEDAGARVAKYLLIQLLVNTIYALPIGLGLYVIGVPNALLWGLLTLVLRFVPYIGSVLAAAFPLFLAFSVAPGWSLVLWTAGLFVLVELVTSNVIEPWLYGSRTGVSPLAIIVAAIVWTWIWGPLGLVLSTPLTVCLVVLGRHLPQFAVFDILFGDNPVLAPHSRLYQRLLAGDPVESTFRAQEALEETYLADYYRDVGLPALMLGQYDHLRGIMSNAKQDMLAQTAARLVADLEPAVKDELAQAEQVAATANGDAEANAEAMPDAPPEAVPGLEGLGFRVVTLGGRSKLDDVAAAMLGQSMAAEGAEVTLRTYNDLLPASFPDLTKLVADCLILNFLDPNPSRASLLHIRRIKLAAPHLRVGVVIWQMPANLAGNGSMAMGIRQIDPSKIGEAGGIGADFVATSLEDAMVGAFSQGDPKPVDRTVRKPQRTAHRARPRAD